MKSVIYGLIAVIVLGLGFWAYQQNYTTQAVLKENARLQSDIAGFRERLTVLRAEWAYLNRPDRLRDLADLNFDRLQLFPLSPTQFGTVDQVAYPRPPEVEVTGVFDVRGAIEEAIE